jgi:hypothetical protein
MKTLSLLSIASIGSVLATLLLTPLTRAQTIAQIFPNPNYSTTTIVTPGIVTETTTTPVIINGNVFGSTGVTDPNYYPYSRRSWYRRPQPTIVIQSNVIYPAAGGRNCTTTIIGSPIPSPVPIDSRTGQFCR